MKKLRNSSLLALMVFVFGLQACSSSEGTAQGTASTETEASPNKPQAPVLTQINLDQFQQLRGDDNVQVLDVRTPGEVAAGRIKGAVHINIHDENFEALVKEQLDTSRPIAVYCQSGGRSSRAARMLQDFGFNEVYNFIGGVGAWRSEGLPLERVDN